MFSLSLRWTGAMSRMVGICKTIVNRYPVTRGTATFFLLLPASNTTQQLLDPNRKNYDPYETLRFGIYGGFILAPSLYGWIHLANVIVRVETLRGAILKVRNWKGQVYICVHYNLTILD